MESTAVCNCYGRSVVVAAGKAACLPLGQKLLAKGFACSRGNLEAVVKLPTDS